MRMATVTSEQSGGSPILILAKISRILDCFTVDSPEPSLQQLARQTGLPSSTCQRLVQNMVREGYLDRDGDRYRIGVRLVRWASTGTFGMDVVRLVRPVLQNLRDETGETACFYIRDGAFRTIVAVAETRHVVIRPFAVGMVMPLHAGAPGKIFLAFDPEARGALSGELKSFTTMTPGTMAELDEQAATAREQGYFAAFGERHSDVGSIAAPVFDHSGQLAGAIGLGFPTQRVNTQDAERLGPVVAAAGRTASYTLGYPVTDR